jgi:hypothetical protein
MPQLVNVPGIGQLQFPDGMSQQDMAAAIQHNFPQIHGQQQQPPASAPAASTGNIGPLRDPRTPQVFDPQLAAQRAQATARGLMSVPQAMAGENAQQIATEDQEHGLGIPNGSLPELAGSFAFPGGVEGAGGATSSSGGLLSRMANAQPGQTIGMATGNNLIQLVERGLSHIPGGATIGQAIGNMNDAIGNRVATIVDNLRGARSADPEDAGQMLSDSLDKASIRIKAASGAQFDAILNKIPSGAKIPITNVYSTLKDLTTIPAGAENTGQQFIDPKLVQIRTALEKDMQGASGAGLLGPDGQVIQSGNGMLPIDAVRRLKTMLGGMIQWDGRGDAANGALKKVYGALTQDITEGAQTIDPKLTPMINKANSDYQVATAKMDILQNVINKAGGPDAIFNSLMSQSKTGSLPLRKVLVQLSPADRQLVAATQLKRLGLANPGVQNAAGDAFSADTFLTNWNRMNQDAKEALFGRLPEDYSRNISQLAQNIDRLKAYGKTLSNPSGTASALRYGMTAGGLLSSIITGNYKEMGAVAGTVGVTKLLATALTNPKTVAWLVKQTTPAVLMSSRAAAMAGAIAPRGQRP